MTLTLQHSEGFCTLWTCALAVCHNIFYLYAVKYKGLYLWTLRVVCGVLRDGRATGTEYWPWVSAEWAWGWLSAVLGISAHEPHLMNDVSFDSESIVILSYNLIQYGPILDKRSIFLILEGFSSARPDPLFLCNLQKNAYYCKTNSLELADSYFPKQA